MGFLNKMDEKNSAILTESCRFGLQLGNRHAVLEVHPLKPFRKDCCEFFHKGDFRALSISGLLMP